MLFAFLRKYFFETAWVKGRHLHINGKESVWCWKLHLYYFLSSELLFRRLRDAVCIWLLLNREGTGKAKLEQNNEENVQEERSGILCLASRGCALHA